ncbi:Wash Complex Subunit 2C [Manis pentadactyla]|nr:Wash Complex Subunit 2C [Manis pentadactyla]
MLLYFKKERFLDISQATCQDSLDKCGKNKLEAKYNEETINGVNRGGTRVPVTPQLGAAVRPSADFTAARNSFGSRSS